MRFCDTCCDCSHADFGHEFDADPCSGIGVLQIVNQLCQVFDGVDVMVWWRRNQTDSRRRMANSGDDVIDFMPWQLSAFAGLRTLSHFYLKFLCADQILAGD